MSLRNRLATYAVSQYTDSDPQWSQFIKDHKEYLRDQSVLYAISSSYMQTYQYDLPRYLRSINYNTHLAWIVAFINDLPNDLAFTDQINSLLIPDSGVIELLYTSYVTTTKGKL